MGRGRKSGDKGKHGSNPESPPTHEATDRVGRSLPPLGAQGPRRQQAGGDGTTDEPGNPSKNPGQVNQGVNMLTVISIIPLIGIGVIITREEKETKIIGLVTTLIILILYPVIWGQLNTNNNNYQMMGDNSVSGLQYYPEVIGVDSISMYMIGITIILMPICILST